MEVIMNKYQTPITQELLDSLPLEVLDQLFDVLNNVEFIRRLISPARGYAKDRPRDKEGKIVVDLANPHILENMDYFRPSALAYKKNSGMYTLLRPNANPNSEYGKWIREEKRRCWEGYVRPSDGEWVPGPLYFYINYCPIIQSKIRKGTKQADRIIDFPEMWEGIYWRFHYMDLARNGGIYNEFLGGNHGAELASRGKSKSYSMASILNHNFILGENSTACRGITSIATAYLKEYLIKDGVLNKFISMANFCSQHTQFPRKRLKQSLLDMVWVMGYRDVDLDIERGTLNQVLGVSSKDDESKLRGKRAAFIGIEEFGCHLKGTKVLMYDGSIKNVEDVQIGDKLMGNDNTPRNVQQLYNGTDQLYKITLSNGDFQIVNSHHPVFFKKYNWHNGTYTENLLTAPELMGIKDLNKGYYIPKAIINFQEKAVPINPYFLGLWLGDGDSTRLDIANEDSEVLEWLQSNYDGYIRDLNQSDTCKVFHISKVTHAYNSLFVLYNLYNNKHIPLDYKVNSSNILLLVVAGLIDTDGTYNSSKNFFEITLRYDRKHILEDIKFMCECNGLKCSLSTRLGSGKKKGVLHYRLRISGDLSIIPTKIERKKGIKVNSYRSKKCWNDYTFKVEPYDIDEYYGFTVDSNHLFVLGDLTVTHNTFPRLIDLYNVMLPSVLEGDYVFGLMYLLGCVCAGTKVWTKQGKLVNIEELKLSDGIIGSNEGVPSMEDITWIQPPTKKECVRIQLEDRFLECSTDHPILVRNLHSHRISTNSNIRDKYYTYDFKPAGLLTPKDYVCISQFQGVFGNINLKDSRLIGLLIGDGTYNFDNSPRFANADLELLEYVKNNYDCVVTRSHITKDSRVYEELRIRKMCPKLREIGIYGQVGLCKRLPVSYLELNRLSVVELLAGLYDTDGSVSVKGTSPNIILTQASKLILEEVKILLLKFGVYSRIYVLKARVALNRKDTKDCYNLIISLEESIRNFSTSIPLMVKHKVYNIQLAIKFFELRKLNRVHRLIRRPYTVIESRVQSIQNIGVLNIYNLTAGNTHTYLANGIITHNTAGDNESDFAGALEIMYNPKGYNMYALPNVFDKNNQGKKNFVFFFPGYVNRKGCYNKDGVSDVVLALVQILMNRYRVKYNSTDPNTIIKTIAEVPITPAEAIVKTGINMFPVTDLTERLGQLDNNPSEYDDVYVGELVINKSGEVEYKPTTDKPIREFPHKDNKIVGAIEMFLLPKIDKSTNKPYANRYILGCLKEGELINTDSGLKRVEVVTLQDKLINTDGNFVNIKNCQRYYNSNPVYKVKLSNIYDSTTFSEEHPIYCATPKRKYRGKVTCAKTGLPQRYCDMDFLFRRVADLKVGDYVKSPIPYKEVKYTDISDPDIWYLIGVILGDGWASCNNRNINIAFNSKELYLISKVLNIVETKLHRKFSVVKDAGTCKEYSFCSSEFNKFISDNFGRGATKKHIPENFKYLPYDCRKSLILGYIDTDGCISNRGIEIVSVSKVLLNDIQDLLFSLKIVSSIKLLNKEGNVLIMGKECHASNKYELLIGLEGVSKIKSWTYNSMKVGNFVMPSITNHNRKYVYIDDDYIYLRVNSIDIEEYTGYVYNFECETHTFMCNYIPTHNCDPYDDDTSDTMSLGSVWVLDLWTDSIVAEYTGRPMTAEEFYEICRRMCLFYNGRMNYENNKKGLFGHFSSRNSLYLLTDILDFLKDKQMMKEGTGNKAKGTNASAPINAYARNLLRSWLLKPVPMVKVIDGEELLVMVPNLYTVRSRALLKELINYNNEGNFDRISAMGMLMLLRLDKMILYQNNISQIRLDEAKSSYLGNDPFFKTNYDNRFKGTVNLAKTNTPD